MNGWKGAKEEVFFLVTFFNYHSSYVHTMMTMNGVGRQGSKIDKEWFFDDTTCGCKETAVSGFGEGMSGKSQF